MIEIKKVGWSASKNKFGDETGVCHLLVCKEPSNVCRPACGTYGNMSGQCHSNPPDYAPHACKRCIQSEASYIKSTSILYKV